MSSASRDPASLPEDLFARWLVARGEGARDFEAFVREHAGHEQALRELHARWEQVEGLMRRAGLGGSLSERLAERYGEKVEPAISLHAKEEKAAPFTESVMQRLTGRSVASGRYAIRGEIARGGMGVVLRVWDEDLRRSLAMKVILGKDGASADGGTPPVDTRQLARFLEEAQVTGQLDHPGIVPVHELGLDASGQVYFTMKLVKGQTLKEVFDLVRDAQEGWTRTRALGVLLKVCEAMAYAHDKGVIHRDLKPGNVMVGKYGEVYVMDWGLARVLDQKDERDLRIRAETPRTSSELLSERAANRAETPESPLYTMDGDVVGTPAYMSPEQARGDLAAMGPPSDVYALGAMLYHLLAGYMPYVPYGARLNNYAVWGLVQQGPPPSIASLAPDAPAELVAICEKAMAREISARYRDMSALSKDLAAFVEGRVVAAYQTGAWAETKKWVQRNKGLAAALAAAVLLLAGGLATSLSLGARAERNAARADEKAAEAERLGDEALARADALWAIEELKNFHTLDDDLEYARSQDRPTYVWWPEKAHELVDGRPADPTRGLRKKPGLADHQRLLAEIRLAALPPTEAELAADRGSHPKAKELETKHAELLWISRMLGLEPWPSEAELAATLAGEQLPSDAKALNSMAWKLVHPDGRIVGQEAKALVAARRAVAEAKDKERAMCRDTLAWALLWTGNLDEAVAEERRAIQEVGPEKRIEYEGRLHRIESLAQPFRDGKARTGREALAAEVAALEREVSEQQTYRFDEREKEWWNTQLGHLEQNLEELEQRITLAERSVTSPEASHAWKTAIESIAAHPKYGGLRLTPQLELLPLGPDPASGLWEFAHLGTGVPAVRGADGKFALEPETGLVFVLLPSGPVPVEEGMQSTPLNKVLLEPFFLSKYEMTVAQWGRTSRWTGRFYNGPMLPANGVSWDDCVTPLERAGIFLRLPTEAQWEYGCRAGTTTRWWTGATEDSLLGAANIDFDILDKKDGKLQAISSLLANPFGLHDVHGNVWEWCSDEYGDKSVGVRPGDGEREATNSRTRVVRGGGFPDEAALARSGNRGPGSPEYRRSDRGLRVARSITP